MLGCGCARAPARSRWNWMSRGHWMIPAGRGRPRAPRSARRLLASRGFRHEVRRLRSLPLADFRGAMGLKRRVLELLARCAYRSEPGRKELEAWERAHPEAAGYARFRATVEKRGTDWRSW